MATVALECFRRIIGRAVTTDPNLSLASQDFHKSDLEWKARLLNFQSRALKFS